MIKTHHIEKLKNNRSPTKEISIFGNNERNQQVVLKLPKILKLKCLVSDKREEFQKNDIPQMGRNIMTDTPNPMVTI